MESVVGFYTEIYEESPLDYTGDVIVFLTGFVRNLSSEWLDVISDKVCS